MTVQDVRVKFVAAIDYGEYEQVRFAVFQKIVLRYNQPPILSNAKFNSLSTITL